MLLVAGAAVLWYVARAESWAVYAIMVAPLLDVRRFDDDAEARRKRSAGHLAKFAVGLGAAALMHYAMSDMLGGFVRHGEVVFNGWVFTGALYVLDYIDRGLRLLMGKTKLPATAQAARLIVVVFIALAGAAAMMQVVRCKIGYELPREALAMEPAAFAVRSRGATIRGYWFDRGAPVTLIVTHGLGAHAENFMPYLTRQLRDQNVNGLIFDFRGHGYSDGHVSSFGSREADDLRAVVAWLEREHPAHAQRLVFYGFSMGSAAVAPVAAEHPRTVGLIVDSGFAELPGVAAALGERMPAGIGRVLGPAALPVACVLSGANLYVVSPERDLGSVGFPMLVLHGTDDQMIPLSQGERLMRLPRAEGVVVNGGEHTNLAIADALYFDRVGRFIELIVNDAEPTDDESIGPPSLIAPPPNPAAP